MLSIETRNQGKKNGNVVRTYIWIRPVSKMNSLAGGYVLSKNLENFQQNLQHTYNMDLRDSE